MQKLFTQKNHPPNVVAKPTPTPFTTKAEAPKLYKPANHPPATLPIPDCTPAATDPATTPPVPNPSKIGTVHTIIAVVPITIAVVPKMTIYYSY